MDTPSLERVQHDLDVVKSSLASDFPYDRGSLVISLAATLCGVPFALRAVPGWDSAMLVVLGAGVAGLVIGSANWFRRARSERALRPRRWSFGQDEALAAVVAVLGLSLYALLTRWNATEEGWTFAVWRDRLAGPALFGFGIGMTALALIRPERRSYLGWGLALAVLGASLPWVSSRPAFWVAAGSALTLGGLVSSVILWRQLRQWETMNGGH
jgi:hypothetical protein